ncbi:MAG: hypothetical protein ACR2OW_00240 [Methyloligellaceae bacterium]
MKLWAIQSVEPGEIAELKQSVDLELIRERKTIFFSRVSVDAELIDEKALNEEKTRQSVFAFLKKIMKS